MNNLYFMEPKHNAGWVLARNLPDAKKGLYIFCGIIYKGKIKITD